MPEQAQILRWEEPPPKRKGVGRPIDTYTSRYTGIAEELRGRPAEWALIEEAPGGGRGLATKIRLGAILCFSPAGDFESVVRRVNGVSRTYARYLGHGDA